MPTPTEMDCLMEKKLILIIIQIYLMKKLMFFENKTDDEKVIPSVTINGISPSQAEDLSINPVDDFVLLDENIPGSIGKAFDFFYGRSF